MPCALPCVALLGAYVVIACTLLSCNTCVTENSSRPLHMHPWHPPFTCLGMFCHMHIEHLQLELPQSPPIHTQTCTHTRSRTHTKCVWSAGGAQAKLFQWATHFSFKAINPDQPGNMVGWVNQTRGSKPLPPCEWTGVFCTDDQPTALNLSSRYTNMTIYYGAGHRHCCIRQSIAAFVQGC